MDETLALAREHGRSAYDTAYLQTASASGEDLVTGDRRLLNAAAGRLPWVRWVGDWA
jgi:predicted nucleic acid-binding protein